MSFLTDVGREQQFDPFVVFREGFAFVPNLVQAQNALPRAMTAHAKLEEAVAFRDGAISRIHKERILLSIAAHRRDEYCVALDSGVLSSIGVPQVQIDDLLNDYREASLSAPDQALLEFCHRLSRNASSVGYQDIEALRAQGHSDEAILVAVVTAQALYRCTLSVALGPEPDFKPSKFPPKKDQATSEARLGAASSSSQPKAEKKRPYLPAPYLLSVE